MMNDECSYFDQYGQTPVPFPSVPYCDYNHYSIPPRAFPPQSVSYPYPPPLPYLNNFTNSNSNSSNNFDGMMMTKYDNYSNPLSSLSNSVHSVDDFMSMSTSKSPKQSAIDNNMVKMEKMEKMMQEMKQNMNQMLMMNDTLKNTKDDKQCNKPPKKRQLDECIDIEEYDHEESVIDGDSECPEVGLRASATIRMSKDLFVGNNAFYFEISQEILLRALERILEFRWIHSKHNVDRSKDVEIIVFIDENLGIPKEFVDDRPKRGRPPKIKKQKVDNNNANMSGQNAEIGSDKVYRFNFQIVFQNNVFQKDVHEIIQCIKIDLNQNSLSLLLTNVLSARVSIIDKVHSYSLHAINAGKLREYEKYEKQEEERKSKKRVREQLRRAKKKESSMSKAQR